MNATWTIVCNVADLTADRGVCALVGGAPVAVFRLSGSEQLYAIDNHDPFCDASVLSRGLVGALQRDGEWVPYVASPLRKHRFDLRTGQCLDDPDVCVGVWEVDVNAGIVAVGVRHTSS